MVVVPAAAPVTIPVEPTEAVVGAAELQVPPDTASVSAVVVPTQTKAVPVMVPALAAGFTVTTLVAAAARPQLLVTV